ncbi:hypothetical protein GCM10022225_72240 [Plantactinospora mayteni]|uniref:Transposase IS4 N-terminal domain-containing protein n=1 Tax=Plantactinospora mayteni TaxID=566021 RepID=A0ABQ4F1D7_9ACTN|nr:hypothetical protein Pma05_72500 [Plantactinospora mayteni]
MRGCGFFWPRTTYAAADEARSYVNRVAAPALGAVAELVPSDLVDEVISECGRGDQRIRSLPNRVTLYFVLALWLCDSGRGREYGAAAEVPQPRREPRPGCPTGSFVLSGATTRDLHLPAQPP